MKARKISICLGLLFIFGIGNVFAKTKEDKEQKRSALEKTQKVKKNINISKVNEFITKIGESFDKNPKFFDWNIDKTVLMIKKIDLNEYEYLEVQKKIANQINIEEYATMRKKKDHEGYKKYTIYHLSVYYPLSIWEDRYSSKERLIMEKVIPRIASVEDKIKPAWIIILNKLLLSIHNAKMTISKKNVDIISDELFKVFSSTSSSFYSKKMSAKAWTAIESREDIKYKGIAVLMKDENLFEFAAYYFRDFNCVNNSAPKLMGKMFSILENRDKYSNKIINGALGFFKRESFALMQGSRIKERVRLRKILQNLIKKEKDSRLKIGYETVLSFTEEKKTKGVK